MEPVSGALVILPEVKLIFLGFLVAHTPLEVGQMVQIFDICTQNSSSRTSCYRPNGKNKERRHIRHVYVVIYTYIPTSVFTILICLFLSGSAMQCKILN